MIQLKNVIKAYRAKEDEKNGGEIRALDNVSLSVAQGEWVAMMGPSGSGKSTMVNLIGCLDRPSSGEIWLDGENVADFSPAELNRVRAEKIGFVFQQFHLIPFLTAVENVMLAQYFHSMTDEKEALDALEKVGLKERAHHLPSQLSGGEQQRVCIARALINDPKIVLADEPTGNLDAQNEEIVLRLLRELHQQGRTIIMVTHDPVVARLADRIADPQCVHSDLPGRPLSIPPPRSPSSPSAARTTFTQRPLSLWPPPAGCPSAWMPSTGLASISWPLSACWMTGST